MNEESPQALVELGAELRLAAKRTFATSQPRSRTSQSRRRATALALPTLAVAGVLLALTAIIASRGSAPHANHTPDALRSLDVSFVVLRRPAQPSDSLPSVVGQRLTRMRAYTLFGLQPDKSRLLSSTGQASVWLVPGTKGACLLTRLIHPRPPKGLRPGQAGGVGCDWARGVERSGMVEMAGDAVVGVLPAGSVDVVIVRNGGQRSRLRLNHDGTFGFDFSPEQLPINLYFTAPGGPRQHYYLAHYKIKTPPNPRLLHQR